MLWVSHYGLNISKASTISCTRHVVAMSVYVLRSVLEQSTDKVVRRVDLPDLMAGDCRCKSTMQWYVVLVWLTTWRTSVRVDFQFRRRAQICRRFRALAFDIASLILEYS